MKPTQHRQTNTHVFCHSRLRNQSLVLNTRKFQTDKLICKQVHPNSNKLLNKPLSNFTNNITNQNITTQTINVITRNRPQIETSTRPILKRFRRPNKKKITTTPTMENSLTRPPLVTISTQTEQTDKFGKGREPIQTNLHPQIFPLSNHPERMPDYRKHLSKVFGEEFLAEAAKQDRSLTPIIKMIRERDWESLKKTNKYFHSLRKSLAVMDSGCMLNDNKLVIPRNLKQLVIDAIHQTHRAC